MLPVKKRNGDFVPAGQGKRVMEKISSLVIKYHWIIIVLVILITGYLGYQIRYIKVDSNVVESLPGDDPEVRQFKEVGNMFGGNQMGMVILEADNVLSPVVLGDIDRITDTLSEMNGILSVLSLTNVMNIKVEGDNFEIGKLINENNRPDNDRQADSLRKVIVKNDMVTGRIISRDGTASNIIFMFRDNANTDSLSQAIMDKLKAMHLSEKHYFAGGSFLSRYVANVITTDLKKLLPISFLLIAVILYFSFHSIRGIVLPLLTAALAIVWALGIFVMLGLKLSMVSNNVPIILLAVGSAYAIHVLNRINRCREKEPRKVIIIALSFMIIPVTLTALTTMSSFLSFIFGAYLKMIRDFGIFATLGTFFSALLALTLVPALLSILPARSKGHGGLLTGDKKTLIATYLISPLIRAVTKHNKRILVVWSLFILVGVFGMLRIKRSSSISNYLKANHPASIAQRIMSEKFGGSQPVYVVFKGDMQSPEVLNAMLEMEKYMTESRYVNNAQSIADVVARLNQAMGGENRIPGDEGKIAQLWFLIGQQPNINQLVTEDLDAGVIIAKFNEKRGSDFKGFKKFMSDYLKNHQSKDYTVAITGMPYINNRFDRALLHSQFKSLLITIILIISIVTLMFKSFLKGLNASLPIIFTIIILYGIMGLTGIPLNIGTVLVASVAMGIGIDYSIHFISHYNHELKHHRSIRPAIEDTLRVSGEAILINFISVSAGFLVLTFSQLVPMIYFGILIALSMFGSSMGAITLLPSIILLEKESNKKV